MRVPGRVVLTEAALASLLALVAHEVPGVVGMAPAGLKDQVGRILGRQEAGEGWWSAPTPKARAATRWTSTWSWPTAPGCPPWRRPWGSGSPTRPATLGVELSQVRVHVVGVRCG